MIIKVVIIAIGVTLLANLIKTDFKTGAILVSVMGTIVLFSQNINVFWNIADSLKKTAFSGGKNSECIKMIIKALAVSYVTNFGADICSDAGEKTLSNAVECIGKITMIGMVFPMLTDIFESISNMIG